MKKICILGAGGFAKEVYFLLIDMGLKNNVECFLEDKQYWAKREVLGLKVQPLNYFDVTEHTMIVAIGDSKKRKHIIDRLPIETKYETLIHPTVIKSDWVEIGEGSIICAGTIITTNITMGKHTQLNLNTTIGHDCVIGDFFTTAPSVNISGNNIIGNNVYFGTNSCTREKIKITDDVVIGMGAVVVKDIMNTGIYVGNPAKLIK